MVKEELVSGIKMAVAEGESLENAMATFYNAGYLKDDIEEAALAVQSPAFSPEELQQLYQKRQAAPKTVAPTTPASQPNQQTIQNIPMLTTAKGVQIQPIMVQRASDYDFRLRRRPRQNKKTANGSGRPAVCG